MGIEIVEVDHGARYQVIDPRGHLITDQATRAEATAFVAGYQAGRYDAAQIVRTQVDQLGKLAASL